MRNIFAVFSSILLVAALSITAQAQNYLTFTAVDGDAMFGLINQGSYDFPVIEYSFDKASWETLPASVLRSIPDGQSVYLRGLNSAISADDEKNITYFRMIGKIAASGSVMSLLDGIGESKDIGADYCFAGLFANCASLTSAPELPATKLSNYCYEAMFQGCSNLEHAPALPASQLAENCYYSMFNSCTSLANAPGLPATQLAPGCYAGMFYNCSGLAVAPSLPAMQLADECYFSMFQGCTGLKEAPGLPAIQLADNCYYQMFYGCSSLASAPDLPAMQLTSTCYAAMFYNCTSLTKAPKLPAAQLADYCYYAMFYGCQNLSQIEVGFTEWDNSATNNWVNGVAGNGLFIGPEGLAKVYGPSNMPEGWALMQMPNEIPEPDYLSFTAVDGSASFGIECHHSYYFPDIEFSFDKENWTGMESGQYYMIPDGSSVYLRGINPFISNHYEQIDELMQGYTNFVMTGKIKAGGSVLSLLDGNGNIMTYLEPGIYYYYDSSSICYDSGPQYACFAKLFYHCESLIEAPRLPATTVSWSCYHNMFNGCTSLKKAPDLPATTIAYLCYEAMFSGCTSLDEAPSRLPATQLAPFCYEGMFGECSSLKKAPELPATVLQEGCYTSMFAGCSSLEEAPYLPAAELVLGCYSSMFNRCQKLNHVRVSFTEWKPDYHACTGYYEDDSNLEAGWLYGVAEKGVFECPEGLSKNIFSSCYIPEGWQTATKYNEPLEGDFLTFTAVDGDAKFRIMSSGDYDFPVIEVSSDRIYWTELLPDYDCAIPEGGSVYMRGSNTSISQDIENVSYFSMEGKIAASGSVMSLIDGTGESKEIGADYCFAGLFYNCQSLMQAPRLPATKLSDNCYEAMFKGCSGLTEAPVLPAEELKEGCYAELFSNCQSLRQIEVKFTEWENSATKKWVDGVETAGGRFIAPQALAGIYGKSHIPVLWMPDGIIPIQQTAESINLTACPGDTAVIDLEMCIERPDYFKAEGIHSDWQAWESESENKIKIPIPEDEAGFGHKILTIHFHNSDGSGANPISASLSINYPNRYIGVIYSDILYVDNHEGIFQQYQWLGADGSEIAGATGQFLQVKSLPSRGGIFSAKITTKSGANLRICPLKVEPAKISKSAEFSIKAYPSPVLSGQEFAIELIGLPGPMLDGCRVSIINSAGTAVKSFHGTEFPVKTQLPPGQYSVVAVSGNAQSTFKIVVK